MHLTTLHHFITAGIEVLFPPSDDELLFRREHGVIPFRATLQTRDQFSFLLPYQEPVVRAAIHLNKFHYHVAAQQTLANALTPILMDAFPRHLIIPIPLSGKRYRDRGYNQVEAVLRHVPDIVPATTLLRRTRHTTPQSDLPRAERLTNLNNAFSVKRPERIAGQHILIIDDVATTGATFSAARAELSPHSPASITCLAFAH